MDHRDRHKGTCLRAGGLLVALGLLAAGVATTEGGRTAPGLIPADPDFAEYGDLLQQYHTLVRDALLGGNLHAECEVLVLPSFEREWAVHVTPDVGRRQVVYTVMKEQLWAASHKAAEAADGSTSGANLRAAFARVPRDVLRHSAPISEPVARELHWVWKVMLDRARKPAEDEWGLDGTSYHLFERNGLGADRAGTTWSPGPQTPAGHLAALVQLLRDHAQKSGAALAASEAELSARSKKLLESLD
ncbi:MAG TPA: hypothetical protein VFQ51_01780 [Vicinamibacteria bacterium]|nr:hypothetical protein [Vicinamibacteria bacterium]